MGKRILLTSVFGPFGVDDAWGRKENIMELFHNQVTKAQGMASLRVHHLAPGVSPSHAPTTSWGGRPSSNSRARSTTSR